MLVLELMVDVKLKTELKFKPKALFEYFLAIILPNLTLMVSLVVI